MGRRVSGKQIKITLDDDMVALLDEGVSLALMLGEDHFQWGDQYPSRNAFIRIMLGTATTGLIYDLRDEVAARYRGIIREETGDDLSSKSLPVSESTNPAKRWREGMAAVADRPDLVTDDKKDWEEERMLHEQEGEPGPYPSHP